MKSLSACGLDPIPTPKECCATNYNGNFTEPFAYQSWNIYQSDLAGVADLGELVPVQASGGYCVVETVSPARKTLYPDDNGSVCIDGLKCSKNSIETFQFQNCSGNSLVTPLVEESTSITIGQAGSAAVSFQSVNGRTAYSWLTTTTLNNAYPVPLMDTPNDIISLTLLVLAIFASLGVFVAELRFNMASKWILSFILNVNTLWVFYISCSLAIWFNLFKSDESFVREILQNLTNIAYNVASFAHTAKAVSLLGKYRQVSFHKYYIYIFTLCHAIMAIPTYFSILGYFFPQARSFFKSFAIFWNCFESIVKTLVALYISTTLSLKRLDGKTMNPRYLRRLSILSYILSATTILLACCFSILSTDVLLDDRRW